MKVIFFGTAPFAVPSLEAVVARHQVAVCVTQPDRPQGRGLKPQASPVKRAADAAGIPVIQSGRLRRADCDAYPADVGVVAAYGQLLPADVLTLPPLGMLGVHPSLLPKYRGAAPVAWALLNGDATTGVTIFRLTEALDAGEILLQESVAIAPEEDSEALTARLAQVGARVLLKTLDILASGRADGQPQDPAQVTFAPKLSKAQGQIDWSQPAEHIVRQVRAFTPWPGAATILAGEPVKCWKAQVRECPGSGAAGRVIAVEPDHVIVSAGRGCVAIAEVQPAGGRRMAVRAFLAGHPLRVGDRLGDK